MTSLSVLQIDDGLSWGGGQDQVRMLAEGLARRGVTSCVATPRGSELSKRLNRAVRQLPLSPVRGLAPLNVARIARFCRTVGIDVVDVHTGSAYGLGLFAKVLTPGVKLVLHRHIDTPINQRAMTRFKYLHAAVDAFIAVSEAVRQSLLEFGVDAAKVQVCWGGVDAALFQHEAAGAARARLLAMAALPPDALLVGSVGRLVAQKDYPTLIRAIAIARQKAPEVRCVLIGEGKDRAALEAEVLRLKLADHVKFLGFQSDVHRLIGGLDVFVLPSVMEGFGLVLVEATLAGSCLVTSDIRSVMDFVKDGQTAMTFAAGDAQGLAEKILALSRNAGLRQTLHANALVLAQGKFTTEHMVDRNLAAYERLMRAVAVPRLVTPPASTSARPPRPR